MLRISQWARKHISALIGARILDIKSYWCVKSALRFESHMLTRIQDGMTETQSTLLACHPDYRNLFVAAGGSYNRANDLPILGENVVKLLNGSPIDANYAWCSQNDSSPQDQPALLAEATFQDLEWIVAEDPDVVTWNLRKKSRRSAEYLDIIEFKSKDRKALDSGH